MVRLKVREVAEAKGFRTPGKLARESRVAYATVHRFWNKPEEVNAEGVTIGVLWRIAQALGVKTADLYEDRTPALAAV